MSFLETLLDGANTKERKKKQTCAIAIAVTALFLVIALIAFAICQVVGISTGNNNEKETPAEEETVNLGETKSIQLSENAIYTGNLLTLNEEHIYNGKPEVINVENTRKEADPEPFISLFENKTKFEATADTINALFDMVNDCNKSLNDDNLILSNAYTTGADGIYSSGEAIELSYCHNGSTKAEDRLPITGVEQYEWIYKNAHKYGFIAISAKSNVFKYVGVTHATAAKSQGLYLNSYLKQLKNATLETPVKLNSEGTLIAYHCAITDVKVPVNYDYEISGDNINGVIVTVNLSKSASSNLAE